MNVLKNSVHIIYLRVPYEEIKGRLIDTSRGIVIKQGESLSYVYEERVPLYIKYSDITIDCSKETCRRGYKVCRDTSS